MESCVFVQALLAALALFACGVCGQLPSNPYYGIGLTYPTRNSANPFVFANTASYANTYYLPYAYTSYGPFAPLRT